MEALESSSTRPATMDSRDADMSHSGSKRGGWITFPFIAGLDLTLSLKHLHTYPYQHKMF